MNQIEQRLDELIVLRESLRESLENERVTNEA
jgi:hypothetical protein